MLHIYKHKDNEYLICFVFLSSGDRKARGRGLRTEAEIAEELERSEDEDSLLSAAGSLDQLAAWIGQDMQEGKVYAVFRSRKPAEPVSPLKRSYYLM